MIIFLAGLQAIPQEYYDAASVDGAGRWARFRNVTLPLLTPEHLLHRDPGPDRRVPGLRPGLRPGAARASRPRPRSRSSTSSTRTASSSSRWATRAPPRGSCSSSWRSLTGDLLPVAAPLGALPVSARRRRARADVRAARAGRSASGPCEPPGAAALRRPADRRRPADDGPVLLDDRRRRSRPGPRSSARRRSRFPTGPHWENYAKMWNALPGRDVRDVLPQLAQARDAQHDRPARQLLDGRLRLRRARRSAAAACCSRCILATLIIPFQVVLVPNFILYRLLPAPVQRERQLDRDAGAAVGRGVLRRRLRDLPAAPVLPGDPAASWPTRPASTARTRGRSSATSTCRWPGRPWRRSRSSLHVDAGTTCSTRSSTCATSTSTRRPSGLAFFQGQFVGKWPEMMAGALVSVAADDHPVRRRPAVLRARHRPVRAQGVGDRWTRRPAGHRRPPPGATSGRVRSCGSRRRRVAAPAIPGDRRPQPPRPDAVLRRLGDRRTAAELAAALDASGIAAIVDLDGGWGDALRRELDRWAPLGGPGRGVRRPRLRDVGRAPGLRRGGGGAACATASRPARAASRSGSSLGLRARDPAGRLVAGGRPAARPAVGGSRRARRAGHDPRRRPDRVLRAARRDERALRGAARAPGLALLADPAARADRTLPGFPPFDELIDGLEAVVARHPGTTFIGAHVGCAPEDLARVDADARRVPELARGHRGADRRARAPAVHGAGPHPALARPGPVRHRRGRRTPALWAVYARFLETRDESFPYDAGRGGDDSGRRPALQGRWRIHGLGLPDDVLRLVYADNARRLLFRDLPGDAGGHVTLHLIPAARWEAWRADPDPAARYTPAGFEAEGFVHCTDGDAEMLAVANRFYAGGPGRVRRRWTSTWPSSAPRGATTTRRALPARLRPAAPRRRAGRAAGPARRGRAASSATGSAATPDRAAAERDGTPGVRATRRRPGAAGPALTPPRGGAMIRAGRTSGAPPSEADARGSFRSQPPHRRPPRRRRRPSRQIAWGSAPP